MFDPPATGSISPHRRAVLIAVNPQAGAEKTEFAAIRLEQILSGGGFQVEIESDIDKIRDAVESRDDLRAVVAAGGDGTIGLLANHLPAATTFAILPQGTENLLAKHLQIPSDPESVAELIMRGEVAALDAGRANGKLFLVMASCGFDADVVRRVHRERKGNIRHWAYAKPIINSIRNYRYPTVSIYCQGEDKPIRAKWAFVFNVPRYAMGLPIAEDADSTDGLLDLCAFRGGNLINGLVYLAGVLIRRHRRWRDTQMARSKLIRIESDDEVPYQLDGDPGGYLPLELEAVPRRLNMIVSPQWMERYQPAMSSRMAI